MRTLGYLLVALLFACTGYTHIKHSNTLAGYAASVHPILGRVGGWPTGALLIGTAFGIALQMTWALILATGFLVATQVLFHRKLGDPANMKHAALTGALLVLVVS